jgi:hypothetical protein
MRPMSALVYRSRSVAPQTDIDLFYLLGQARERNARNGLSGLLLYDRGWFFQWIEGPTEPLGLTWNRIRRDTRHRDLTVLADQQIPVRLFPDWHMRFAHRDRQHEAAVDGFVLAGADTLDDLHLNPEKTPNILAAFSRLAEPGAGKP